MGRLGMCVQMIVIRTTAITAGGREGWREGVSKIVRNAGRERQSYDVLVQIILPIHVSLQKISPDCSRV